MLDLSQFETYNGRICVRCRDEESTLRFLEEMFIQHPEKCRFWSRDENKWDEDVSYVDYFPYLNGIDGGNLCYDTGSYAKEEGYLIVDFYEIPGAYGEIDLGDIEKPEFSLDAIIG